MNRIFGIAALLILTAATFTTVTNRWPAPAINQWQVKLTGGNSYFPALTIFITALPLLFSLLLIKLVVLQLSKKQQ